MFETTSAQAARPVAAGMTPDKLKAELDALVKFPGLSNAWGYPIKTRIDMLATGSVGHQDHGAPTSPSCSRSASARGHPARRGGNHVGLCRAHRDRPVHRRGRRPVAAARFGSQRQDVQDIRRERRRAA